MTDNKLDNSIYLRDDSRVKLKTANEKPLISKTNWNPGDSPFLAEQHAQAAAVAEHKQKVEELGVSNPNSDAIVAALRNISERLIALELKVNDR